MPLPYRTLLIEGPAGKVLVDPGAGPLGPQTGQLNRSLEAAGVQPKQLGTVLLTHAHPDHIGGLLTAEGDPAFPKADTLMARREWEFWLALSVGRRLGTGEVTGSLLIEQMMQRWLETYLFPFAEKVTLLEGDTEILPGIVAFPTPGHTPGHLAVSIASRGQSLLYVADPIFFQQQLEHLDWTTSFDWNPEKLHESRLNTFQRAAHERSLLVACHCPAAGRIEQFGDGFCWVDAPSGTDAPGTTS